VARQAKNKQLEIDASAIRFRAEHGVGEMMAGQRDTVWLARVDSSWRRSGGERPIGPSAQRSSLRVLPAI
jgi:hypothetical protein